MSAFLVSIFTLIISVLLFNVFTYLPMPVIAAILMNIAIGLIDIKVMRELKFLDKTSYVTAIIVAIITLVEDPII
jgi:MFS superfamily sulfate permease-like transporter